jgi:DNA polymerase IV
MNRTILHIDFDSYFASCEQQFNPKLRGKAIGVTATNGRHCIIAASREAKALGVKSPSVTWEAQRIVPDIIFVPASFTKYWEITQKFINICKDYSPYVEIFSLDEVFMDITATQSLFKDKYGIIRLIKERIKNEIGEYITVSVGISHNKLLAKLGSGLNKPNGICEITPQNLDFIYSKCSLTDICGIGERIALRLQKIGVKKLLDLRNIPIFLLKKEFGNVEAEFLKNIGLGKDENTVIPYYIEPQVKSVGRNYCLPQNESDTRIIFQNVYELCEEVALKLRKLGKIAKTGFIYLGGSKSVHGRKTVHFFESAKDLFAICMMVLKENDFVLKDGDYVRRISIGASSLEDSININLSIFEDEDRKHRLLQTIDKINEKFGDHVIRNGFLLYADKLTTVPNGYMADKFERTKFAQDSTF